ncbi:hypothetical protein Pelo_9991 [Pelomyxa schiedti]|nr:hypothetical protein Pelo_9991 [Pelomyxa schiedti]
MYLISHKQGRMNLTNHKLLNPSEDERLLPVLSSTPPSPQLSKPSRPPPMPRPSHPASVPPSTSPPHPPFTVLTQSASFSTLPTTVVSSTTSSSQSAATVPIPALHASAPLIFSSRTPSPPQNIPPQPPQQQQITSSTPSIETLQTNPIPIILTPSSSPSPLIEPSATTPPPYSSESPTTSNTILLSTTPNNNSTTTITVTKTSSSPPVTIIDNTESITESISTPLPHSPEPVHSLHTSSAGESRLHWSWSSAQMNNTLQLKEKRLSSHKVKSGPAITQPLVEPNTGTGEDL